VHEFQAPTTTPKGVAAANENIVIPGILCAPITEKTIPVAKDFEVRAIYRLSGFLGNFSALRFCRRNVFVQTHTIPHAATPWCSPSGKSTNLISLNC